MMKIAITGNIACGKSVAYDVIKSAGYSVIDCDDIVKELYCQIDFIKEAKIRFPQIISDLKIDLNKLSSVIFDDITFKQEFESFIFPKVEEKLENFIEQNIYDDKIFIIVPLLYEAGWENIFDKIIFISSDEDLRKKRLILRNSRLSDIAGKVIKSQISEEEKLLKCDYVIKNNDTLENFKCAVKKLINEI